MQSIKFIYPKIPIGKERPRFNKKRDVVYTPPRTLECEKEIAKLAKSAMDEAGFFISISSLEVSITCVFERKGKKTAKYSQDYPDVDNLAKTVLDGMNNVVFFDDKQVARLIVEKYYSEMNLEKDAYTVITVKEIEKP